MYLFKACKHGQGRPRCDVLRDFARDSLAASGRLLQVWMRDGVLDLRTPDDPWLHPGDHIRALYHCLVLQLEEQGLECLMSRRPDPRDLNDASQIGLRLLKADIKMEEGS